MLVKALGPEHLQLAEDVVQEALLRALHTWPLAGVPPNPAAWPTQTAKNLAFDALRRQLLFRKKRIDIIGSIHRWSTPLREADLNDFGVEIEDAVLRLMFVCCLPVLSETMRVPLALKTLCGFGVGEIASALFLSEAAMGSG